jgi:hypothetical protein
MTHVDGFMQSSGSRTEFLISCLIRDTAERRNVKKDIFQIPPSSSITGVTQCYSSVS